MAHVRVQHPSEAVAVVTLDDPDRRNSLSNDLCAELVAVMDELHSDGRTAAVVVTGEGRAFCAGADLSQLGASREEGLRRIYDGFLAVAASPLPTVAAVNGAAVGAGMNLALACDVRIAGPGARFDCRFLDLGIHPGGGHTWMLRRIVGPQVASAMVLFGEVLDAGSAVRHGLALDLDDDPVARSVEMAGRAASMPHELSRTTKATLAEVAGIDSHAAAVDHELAKQVRSMDDPAFAQRLDALRSRISSR